MPRLTTEQQFFLVDELATFHSPSEAAAAFEARFDIMIDRAQVAKYNPDGLAGAEMSQRLKTRFHARRQAFIEQIDAIPIAHRAYRIQRLHEMEIEARRDGDRKQAAALIDQAAKESGSTAPPRPRAGGRAGSDQQGGPPAEPELTGEEARRALSDAIAHAFGKAR